MEISSYEAKKLAMIHEVTVAFDGVPREDGVTYHQAWVIDDYGTEEEFEAAAKLDTEARWQDVVDKDIHYGNSVLNFLDAKGFRYYLQAYIVWDLRNQDKRGYDFDSMTPEWIMGALTLDSDEKMRAYGIAKFELFTVEESIAIARYLVFKAQCEADWTVKDRLETAQRLAEDGMSQEEIDAAWEDGEQYGRDRDLPDNYAQRALDRYWSQFLNRD